MRQEEGPGGGVRGKKRVGRKQIYTYVRITTVLIVRGGLDDTGSVAVLLFSFPQWILEVLQPKFQTKSIFPEQNDKFMQLSGGNQTEDS